MRLISITGSLIVCGFYRQTYFISFQINNDITMNGNGRGGDLVLLPAIVRVQANVSSAAPVECSGPGHAVFAPCSCCVNTPNDDGTP